MEHNQRHDTVYVRNPEGKWQRARIIAVGLKTVTARYWFPSVQNGKRIEVTTTEFSVEKPF